MWTHTHSLEANSNSRHMESGDMGFSRLHSALQHCQMESQVKFYLYSAILQIANLPRGALQNGVQTDFFKLRSADEQLKSLRTDDFSIVLEE